MGAMVASLLALWAVPALAWQAVGSVWPTAEVTYAVGTDLAPFDDAAAMSAVFGAFAAWEGVPCSAIRFAYDGRTAAPVGADGRTTVTFSHGDWTLAEPTHTALQADGTLIVEGDVLLDLSSGSGWALSGADGVTSLDVQAALAHEVGHLLGLGDSDVEGATMNPAAIGHPDGRTLSEDDVEGLCALYPAAIAGEGALGDACTSDLDCGTAFMCLVEAGRGYCAPPCPDGRCPGGYACLKFQENPVCAVGGCGCAWVPADPGSAGAWGAVVAAGLVGYRRRLWRRIATR